MPSDHATALANHEVAEILSDLSGDSPVSFRRRVRRWFFHRLIRAMLLLHRMAMVVATPIGWLVRRRRQCDGLEILLTGTFYSDNWVNAHIRPLAASKHCSRLWLVSTWPVPPAPKVVTVYPPDWLKRAVGAVPARLLVFCWTALRRRPHIVGGFHLLVNGLVAAVVARLVGARSLYFCVGGPEEVLGGGVNGENRLFKRMETPDFVVQQRLVRAVGSFDLVVTMGSGAVRFFRRQTPQNVFHVVSGGIDDTELVPATGIPMTDLVLVARLVPLKRIDVFLQAIKRVSERLPHVTAVIIGDGELRADLEKQACELNLNGAVRFVGYQKNVGDWLRQAKLFVLTSDSEGLALSLMEAMTCGLPAVVSNVGDLGDLVQDGVNGCLVERRRPEAFADRIVDLLTDDAKRSAFSAAARDSAMRYRVANVTRQWDEILAGHKAHVRQ